MDTWFTYESLVVKIKEEGLDVTSIAKVVKQKYVYCYNA